MIKWLSIEESTRALVPPELWRIFAIALPIVLSRASYVVMLFADRLMLSRVGKYELAASMSGSVSTLVLTSFFVGLVGYVTALVSQYYGANQRHMCTRSTIQALFVAAASYPILLAFIPYIGYVFEFVGQDPTLATLANTYAQLLLAGSIVVIVRAGLEGFFVGIGKTKVVMIVNASGVAVSILLNYLLIFGRFGFPELGIVGAALGTIGGGTFTAVVLFWRFWREVSQEDYRVENPFRFVPDLMQRLLRFGLPTGVEPFLNFFAFNVFLQLMHSYGPDVAAAATLAFNWDAMVFIPLVGLSTAATTLGGQHLGAGNPDKANDSVNLTLKVSYGFAAIMILAYVLLAEALIGIFVSGSDDLNDEIAAMSVTMLRLVTLSTLPTAYKLVQNGLLRAAGDTVWVMWVSVAIHWGMAIGALLVVQVFQLHPHVAWSLLIIMNMGHAAAVFYRYRAGVWREKDLIGAGG